MQTININDNKTLKISDVQLNDVRTLKVHCIENKELSLNLIQLSSTLRKAFHINILSSEIVEELKDSGFKFSWSNMDNSFLNTNEKFSIIKLHFSDTKRIPILGETYKGYDVYSWYKNIKKNGKINKGIRKSINGMQYTRGFFSEKKINQSVHIKTFEDLFGRSKLNKNIDECLKLISLESNLHESLDNIKFMISLLGDVPKSEYYFNTIERETYESLVDNKYNIFETLNNSKIKLFNIYNLSKYMKIHEDYIK